jgi:ABC-type branched-subunit amino acid transport system ATPase component
MILDEIIDILLVEQKAEIALEIADRATAALLTSHQTARQFSPRRQGPLR